MPLYAFSIDLDRCVGCQACVVACKIGNERPLGDNYIKVHDIVSGQLPNLLGLFAHHRCFHCADAACVAVCPTGTLTKTATGMTAVDADRCSGCGYCTNACPYGVPTLVNGRVSKCVACLDVVADGQKPYCVQTCPSQAIKFGERDQLLADAQARVAVLKARYPNAHVYGQSQLGGLGLLMILLDKPGVYALPDKPIVAAPIQWHERIVRPLTLPLAALSVAFTGFSFIIARREHLREKATVAVETTPAPEVVLPVAQASDAVESAPIVQADTAAETPSEAPASADVQTPPAAPASDVVETPTTKRTGDKEGE